MLSEQTFAKQILVRVWLVAQKLLRTMLFAEIPMVQGVQCSGCPAERAISPAMYDPTLHIDGLCRVLIAQERENDCNFVPLGSSTMQKEVA
jgi:hypothetical protein